MRNLAFAAFFALLPLMALEHAGCHNSPQPVAPAPSDAAMPASSAACAAACSNMRRLSCPLGNDTPAGAKCEDVCTNSAVHDATAWPTACLAAAKACGACN